MAAPNVLSEMTKLNLLPRGSAAWQQQRTAILHHLAAANHPRPARTAEDACSTGPAAVSAD